ncbi:MAG: sulfatase-like hydrolase/transferase, partial [Candidatus Hydrogenedentes bacterium]|nr:sulfatase-like hydrolase/transferase [Candidatus Hydrogenedentota bacterium]
DLYDNAITYLDKQIGEFLARVKARPEMQDACIVIASAYGLDFSAGWNARGEAALTESSLRVPLYIQAAGQARGASSAIVELEDVAPTLATLLQVDFPQVTTGMNLLEAAPGGDAISMSAEPLALSLRNDLWRFTWQSGLFPFTQVENAEQGVIEFFNISYYERKWRQPDNLRQQPTLAYQYRDRLWNYVKAGIERENEELGMKN